MDVDSPQAPIAEWRREYAELLALVTANAVQHLDEIRLPLHILLENRFGDLNENQEEMLGAARTAAEQASDAFQDLKEIADLDRGAVTPRRDRVRPGDLITSLLPALIATGARRDVRVSAEIAPALQPIVADRSRLQRALELVLHDCVRRTAAASDVQIALDVVGRDLVMQVHHGSGAPDRLAMALANRLIAVQGGTLVERADDAGQCVMTELRLSL